mgnify:CR=1 FL=1
MELSRCFIAIDLPRNAIKEIKNIQKLIGKKFIFTGKFIEEENLHLTLKFLGEIDVDKTEEIKRRLKTIKLKIFNASLNNIGVFSKRFPKIIWVKFNGAEELQKEIDNNLKDLFEPENRFMSHVTIARIKYINEKKGLVEYLKALKCKEEFIVDKFYLKKSELLPEGPVYKIIKGFELFHS